MIYTNASEVVSNTTKESLDVSNSTSTVSLARETPQYGPYRHHADNANDFHFYGIGVVIPFGLFGNAFSICIFLLSPILRRTTTGQFLVALAIADSTVLVGEVLRWFCNFNTARNYYLPKSLGLNIYDTSIAACSITNFLRYGGGLCSVWLTIAIAMERMAAVAFPLRISLISTLRRSRVSIFIIAVISFSLAAFSFWSFTISGAPQCVIANDASYQIWNTVILKLGTLVIPGVLLAILTVIIVVLLYRARNKRKSQLAVTVRSQRKKCSNPGLSTEIQLTIMLVAVCVATIALRAPYTIAYYYPQPCWGSPPCKTLRDAQTFVAYRVTEVFNVINYAINFILYCMSGRSFREQIRKVMCRGNRPGSNCDSQQTYLETHPTPLVGSNIRLLKATPKASSMAQTNNI